MANDFVDFVKDYKSATIASAGKEHISVLVLGPNTSSRKPSAKLRKYIVDQCNKHRRITVTGEHKSLIEIFKQVRGKFADLCHYELDLADSVNALVIIPSSPGSFIELGMFSIIESICTNSLVLFDKKFESDEDSFVTLGAKRAFDNRGADTIYIDYTDKEQAWILVDQYLQNKQNNKRLQKRLAS